MGTSTNLHLPWPELNDSADVPLYIRNLCEAADLAATRPNGELTKTFGAAGVGLTSSAYTTYTAGQVSFTLTNGGWVLVRLLSDVYLNQNGYLKQRISGHPATETQVFDIGSGQSRHGPVSQLLMWAQAGTLTLSPDYAVYSVGPQGVILNGGSWFIQAQGGVTA